MRKKRKKHGEKRDRFHNVCAPTDIDPAIVNFIVHRYIAKLIRRMEEREEIFASESGSGTEGSEH